MKNEARYVVVVVAVIVLGAGVAGASAYTGRAVTTRLSEQTAVFNRLFPQMPLEEHVEHGLFRSTRAIEVRVGCLPMRGAGGQAAEKSAPLTVLWRDTIHHVPFMSARGRRAARIDSELEIRSAGAQQVFGTRTPFTMRTDIDFDGQFESDAKLAHFQLAPKPGDELVFTGIAMHLQGTLPKGAGRFSYTGNIEPIRVGAKTDDGDFSASVGKIELSGSADIDPDTVSVLVPYRTETRIAALTMQVAAPARDGLPATRFDVALRGVVGTAESKVVGDLFSMSSRVQGSLETSGFSVDKFELASSLRNLHEPTFAKLTAMLMNRGFSCDPSPSLADPMAEVEALATMAAEFLPYDPEYEVGPIVLERAGKRAELSYMVAVRGIAKGVVPPPLLEVVTKHGFARAEAKVHLGLVGELIAWGQRLGAAADGRQGSAAGQTMSPDAGATLARVMLEGFVQQGYLEREAESVHARVEFDAGSVKLNGKPFELPSLAALGVGDLDVMKGLMAAEQSETN